MRLEYLDDAPWAFVAAVERLVLSAVLVGIVNSLVVNKYNPIGNELNAAIFHAVSLCLLQKLSTILRPGLLSANAMVPP